MQYELFYLVGASHESELEKIQSEAEEIVTGAQGKFLEKMTLEKRRLSYEVKHETHGIYIARRFELENGEELQQIAKKLNLNGNILRFILSRADELPALKTKEERIAGGSREERKAPEKKEARSIIKKEIEKKEVTEIKEETIKEEEPKIEDKPADKPAEKKKEEPKNDDIDKKLEEILNI